MARVWVLDTETKGTGAEMVPLDKLLERPARRAEPLHVPRKHRPRPAPEPEPRAPRRFRVVDNVTQEVLAEDADTGATLDVLRAVPSIVDVRVSVWQPAKSRWRLLTLAEQRALWQQRDRRRGAA
jgi:hypothetical protein